MSTFLIFGATGATGRFLLPRLLAQGAHVNAVSRQPPRSAAGATTTWVTGDLFGAVAPLPSNLDVVVSLGPLDAFSNWCERHLPPGVRRIVAISSMSADSKRDSPDPAEREMATRLLAAEARLKQSAAAGNIAWTIFRPTLIYGDGRDRSLAPIARFARRWRILPIPLGAHGLRQPVHAADLADAVFASIDCAAAAGQIYPLGGGERLRFDALLWRLRAALPGFVLPMPVPERILRGARVLRVGRAARAISDGALQRLREPLIADNTAAVRDLGYAPRDFIAADVIVEK